MKLLSEVHPDKLRGGFYTEPHVVDFCLERIHALRDGLEGKWLEPSCGDGAFIRGLSRVLRGRKKCEIDLTAVELISEEAGKSQRELEHSKVAGGVHNYSFFDWAKESQETFDVVVGNPPFVRYQFVNQSDRTNAEMLVEELGISLRRVANLWIPFALVALDRLRTGGCFALVLPSELFCTASGGQFRKYLVETFTDLQADMFPRGTFPGILQDVVVLSGKKAVRPSKARPVRFCEHKKQSAVWWQHRVVANDEPWLKYLLSEREYDAYCSAKQIKGFFALGQLAKLEVAIVTGANPFFTIPDATADEYELWDWTIPLLARTSDSPGIVFTNEDHAAARAIGNRTWLLDFSDSKPTPNGHGRVSEYLALGESQGLPKRYKCRIREPWYRVPHIRRGKLMMTKRAHHYHRLLLNEADAYTTDTIYRGQMHPTYQGRETDLVATFQNTLTLLSSEIEGRTYGGGVLELVPSEVAKLIVPLCKTKDLITQIDLVSRTVDGQKDATNSVMKITDDFLIQQLPGYQDHLELLNSARRRLQSRRQDDASS